VFALFLLSLWAVVCACGVCLWAGGQPQAGDGSFRGDEWGAVLSGVQIP